VKEFLISSTLNTTTEILWAHAVSPAGVNREFRPLLRMTFPRDVTTLTSSWQPGRRLFRSWLLLGGFLPVDYDDLAFVEIEPGRRFLERSSLLSQKIWEHERLIEPVAGGSRLTDRLCFTPRIGPLGPIYAAIFKGVFRWRHHNLKRDFGALMLLDNGV
jgi:ligand-binding SRPBCC domain-containing protein